MISKQIQMEYSSNCNEIITVKSVSELNSTQMNQEIDFIVYKFKDAPQSDLKSLYKIGKKENGVINPLIIVMGPPNLEVAVNFIKMGAIDYIPVNLSIQQQLIKLMDLIEDYAENFITNILWKKIFAVENSIYPALISSFNQALHVLDKNLQFIFANKECLDLINEYGANLDPKGKYLKEIFPFLPDSVYQEYQTVFETGKPIITREKNNLEHINIETETRKLPIKFLGNTIAIITVISDVTVISQTESALQESEQRYRETIDFLPQSIYETDLQGNLTLANKQAFQAFGYTQEDFDQGLQVLDMVSPEDRERAFLNIQKRLKGSHDVDIEYSAIKKDGSTFPVAHYSNPIMKDGVPIGLRGVLIDITKQKQNEELLIHSRKMDAIGQLSAGIAHDFNNILAGIIGVAEVLKHHDKMDEEYYELTDLIIQDSRRGADLTSKLLTFSQKRKTTQKQFDLHQLINDSTAILRRVIDKRIEITQNFNADIFTILGSSSLLHNTLLNIGINAGQAMPKGGNLIFSTSNITLSSENMNKLRVNLPSGIYVKIDISDTGSGIEPEHLSKLFDPFFTTKPPGEGTGLGLSVAYGTIQEMKGDIKVQSELGKGTVFSIYIPITEKITTQPSEEEFSFTGSETILMVDDEANIRFSAIKLLTSLGFTVIDASNGQEALEILQSQSHEIDLIILDMIMPIMNGIETFEKIKELNIKCPVIISTGYVKEQELETLNKIGISGLIRKPFQVNELSKIIFQSLKKKN